MVVGRIIVIIKKIMMPHFSYKTIQSNEVCHDWNLGSSVDPGICRVLFPRLPPLFILIYQAARITTAACLDRLAVPSRWAEPTRQELVAENSNRVLPYNQRIIIARSLLPRHDILCNYCFMVPDATCLLARVYAILPARLCWRISDT